MAAYSKRHYGQYKWQLVDPKLIVIHFAVGRQLGAIYNTFAPNRPTSSSRGCRGSAPTTRSGRGRIAKFVPDSIRCRHVVGLNHVSIGIEHVGFSDGDILRRKPDSRARCGSPSGCAAASGSRSRA